MAALVKHGLSKNNEITINLLFRNSFHISNSSYANKKYKPIIKKVKMPECRKLDSTKDCISSRGFLRCQRGYEPPSDLEERLESICKQKVGNHSLSDPIDDSTLKYFILDTCSSEFKHSVPNSLLHTIKCFGDILLFYKTPVDNTLPLDKMKTVELPPNLHIQYEPLRFIQEEDTMFGGQTAFPKSNTLVTGIRTRKKYKGNKLVEPWNID